MPAVVLTEIQTNLTNEYDLKERLKELPDFIVVDRFLIKAKYTYVYKAYAVFKGRGESQELSHWVTRKEMNQFLLGLTIGIDVGKREV